MSEGLDAAGDSVRGHVEPVYNVRKVVDQTRQAWMRRPEEFLSVDARIAVGIGFAALTRGGWVIFEETNRAGSPSMTPSMAVSEAERLAQRDPEQDWRIHLVGPDLERHYKRIGAGRWKLYQWGAGFGNAAGERMPRRPISGEPLRS